MTLIQYKIYKGKIVSPNQLDKLIQDKLIQQIKAKEQVKETITPSSSSLSTTMHSPSSK